MGFKPMFEEERLFFKEKTGIDLPTDCWRSGSKIYLDFTQEKPILQFNVKDGKEIIITKDNRNGYKKGKNTVFLPEQKKVDQLIEENKERLFSLFNQSVSDCYDYIMEHYTDLFVVSYSGGKDSDVVYEIWKEALIHIQESDKEIYSQIEWVINFANTTNDTSETYKKVLAMPKDKLKMLNPKKGWSKWLEEDKNYFLPTTMVRNCCSAYKEGQITKAYDNNRNTTMVLGVRRFESAKRSKYELIMDGNWRKENFDSNNLPMCWTNFAPIIEWKDEDVWLFMLWKDIDFNKMYRYGFNRCGCLICPFMSDYTSMLVEKYYNPRHVWWNKMLQKNYEVWGVESRLNWTLEEWQNGKWKEGKSKSNALTILKATPERVKELAALKGISEEMAQKYFMRKCGTCGKKLNPTEIAMFYKIYGRYEGREDNRECLCKKCLCKDQNITAKEYTQKALEFKANGCNLF